MSTPLHLQRCQHQAGQPLSPAELAALLQQVQGWAVIDGALQQRFKFADFRHTMAFVNAVAWIANEQDHHPDMAVSYNQCTLRWNTHSVNGLSINDFICAARVDTLAS
ncbi:MAG: 4a-hydroxytetrahydrobiopterin dehydratase [Aquabacterium sp.]|jgi:4a-hydroxytetrahydrobiopterin dehydratase|uniref:4a-hydroxytetrahydrobiopterin dehydratase n=1 Tax=Aquabacterium sp. TaxID=1872578 RepID=UPI003BB21BC0